MYRLCNDNQLFATRSMTVRVLLLVVACVAASAILSAGGQTTDPVLQERLERLFPDATRFSPKTGNPPHFKVFRPGSVGGGEPALAGFAFYTTELEPLERGYDGPIQILVGMDLRGIVAGVVVVDHNEPYGYYSVDRPEFPAQFVGKSIRDRFKVGDDIDAVSTATVTMRSSTRAIRNGARRMARRFLKPEDVQ